MASRYGRNYGGQFYDGPGALESLLANALEARKGAMDERRARQIEDEERALRAEDRQRRIASEDRARALEAQRLRDEGIVENPAEMGGGFARIPGAGLAEQERIRQDAKAVGEQERARASAAIVGELFAAPPEQRQAIYQRLVQADPAAAKAVATELKPPAPAKRDLQTMTGPDGRQYTFDKQTGEYTLAKGVGAKPVPMGGAGGPGGGDGKPPTVAEQTKGMLSASSMPVFKDMIEIGEDGTPSFKMKRSKLSSVIRGLTPGGMEEAALGITAGAPLVGGTVTEDLRAKRASTQFVDSWIRAVSGAAVPEPELQRYLETYTPAAFDPPEILADKARAWVTLQAALENAAGRAAQIQDPEQRKQFALSVVASGGAMPGMESVPSSSPAAAAPAAFDAGSWLQQYRTRKRP